VLSLGKTGKQPQGLKQMNEVTANSQLLRVEQLSSCDLREEARGIEDSEMWKTDEYNSEQIEILWLPSTQRAGIAWGADADWTDAISPEDALRRFFANDLSN